MAKQVNLEPRPSSHGELDEEKIPVYDLVVLLRRIQDGQQAEHGL
jgi:hypothetical protein